MRGCACATCEAQRAYGRRPDVKARHAVENRAYRAGLSEEQHARLISVQRARTRMYAEQRDAERINQLRRAA